MLFPLEVLSHQCSASCREPTPAHPCNRCLSSYCYVLPTEDTADEQDWNSWTWQNHCFKNDMDRTREATYAFLLINIHSKTLNKIGKNQFTYSQETLGHERQVSNNKSNPQSGEQILVYLGNLKEFFLSCSARTLQEWHFPWSEFQLCVDWHFLSGNYVFHFVLSWHMQYYTCNMRLLYCHLCEQTGATMQRANPLKGNKLAQMFRITKVTFYFSALH